MAHVVVSLATTPTGLFLELIGGDPRGNDDVHRTVSGWAGWKRQPSNGATLLGSRYRARAWLAALQSLVASQFTIAWSPEARAWADQQLEAYRRREATIGAQVRDDEPASWRAAPGGRTPMPHQVQALRALSEMGGAALLKDDMGLGKTTTALLSWAASGCRRALVISPKSVKLNWEEEVQAAFYHLVGNGEPHPPSCPFVYLIDGSPNHRANVASFMRAAVNENRRAIAIINYDLLHTMNEQAWLGLEQWVGGQCVLSDEFHYCKNIDSKRAKSVGRLMELAKVRIGMTGTPVQNTIEDLFAQVELLRPGTWVSYHDFANRHLNVTLIQLNKASKRKTPIVRGGKNLKELNRIINTLAIGRKKTEVLNLPPLIRTKPKLELDGHHLSVYKQMKDFARVELEKVVGEQGEEVSMWHPLARSSVEAAMRCEMLAQGFISGIPEIYADKVAPMIAGKAERIEGTEKPAFVFPDSPKMAWLLDTVERELADRPVVIVSRFNAPILWLEKRLNALKMVGSMDAVSRQEAINSFRKGERRIICVQVKLAAGFNLTNATDVLFLGRDWAPALNEQAEARCHRIGTVGTVNVQIPIVTNTVEKLIERKLTAKDADAQQALSKTTLRELLEAL